MGLAPAERRLKILFTEGASLSARQSLYALGGRHTIDILDPDPLCQCRFSTHVRRWIRSPHFARQPEEFLRFLAIQLRKQEYDILFPTHEQVYLLSRFRDVVGRSVGLALPTFEAMDQMQNKAHFTRALAELDLPYPETQFVRSREELQSEWRYPFFLKLAHGTAGAGVFHILCEEQLQQQANALQESGFFNGTREALVQQPARGIQATIQAVFQRGQLVGCHSFDARQLGVGGMSAARVSVDHPIVREQIEKLGSHIQWHGSMFVDYFYDYDTDQPEYIECNPRVGETVNAWLSDVNICELLARVSANEQVELTKLGQVGLQTQSFFMILMTLAHEGAGRWRLAQEWLNRLAKRGIYRDSQDELTRPGDDVLSVVPLWWVSLQLFAWPGLAKHIVAKTVENYSLPETATEVIKAIPLDRFDDLYS
jgi:predicted ATP-grasp superfamily ATP-dependent carboligase